MAMGSPQIPRFLDSSAVLHHPLTPSSSALHTQSLAQPGVPFFRFLCTLFTRRSCPLTAVSESISLTDGCCLIQPVSLGTSSEKYPDVGDYLGHVLSVNDWRSACSLLESVDVNSSYRSHFMPPPSHQNGLWNLQCLPRSYVIV